MSNISQGFVSILFSRIGRFGLTLVTTPILVRLLGSGKYGDYAFLMSIVPFLLLLSGGVRDGIRKYISEDREIQYWKEQVFGFYLCLGIIIAGLTSISLLIISKTGYIDMFFGSKFTMYILPLAVLILVRQLWWIVRGGLMGLSLEQYSEPLTVVNRAVYGITALILIRIGYGVFGALIGRIIASVAATVAGCFALSKVLDMRNVRIRRTSQLPYSKLLTFNLGTILILILMSSLYHVDILLLQPIAGSNDTGYYRAALNVAELIWIVPVALQMVLLQSTSSLWAENQTDELSLLASRITRYNILFVLLLIIGFATLADLFIPVYYGSDFSPAVEPALLLLPGILGFAIARPILSIIRANGEQRKLIAGLFVAALLNLGLNTILIPKYGMAGAAVATSIGYGSMAILCLAIAMQLGFNPTNDLRLTRIAATALLTAAVLYVVKSLIESLFLSLLLVPSAGLLVYSVFALRFRVLEPDEAINLLRFLPVRVAGPLERVIKVFS